MEGQAAVDIVVKGGQVGRFQLAQLPEALDRGSVPAGKWGKRGEGEG